MFPHYLQSCPAYADMKSTRSGDKQNFRLFIANSTWFTCAIASRKQVKSGEMVVKSKSSTPSVVAQDHPANELSILTPDQIASLAKLQPVYLPNEAALIENDLEHPIHQLRTSWKYIYVANWIYSCRGYVRLQSEYFDIDLFETELLDLVTPPPLDESVLFINKLRVALISAVQGSKCSVNNFENIFRIWFGSKTPLGGREEEDDLDTELVEGEEVVQPVEPVEPVEVYEPRFAQLSLEDKFEILYLMIDYISGYPQFRSWIDKNNISADILRWKLLFHENTLTATSEDHLLLFDCTRLYKRTVKYPQLSIPKKRKLAPADPESFYKEGQFDIVHVKFELITKGIYQFNKYIKELQTKAKRNSKYKAQVQALTSAIILETLYVAEIKKRKFITSRKKDLQLANLLATRKRSSRLEAKEKQRQEELRLARIQEEEELRIAAEKRLERRRAARGEQQISEGMTREERLRMRRNPITDTEGNGADHESSADTELIKLESNGDLKDSESELKLVPIEAQNETIAGIESTPLQVETSSVEVKIPVEENSTILTFPELSTIDDSVMKPVEPEIEAVEPKTEAIVSGTPGTETIQGTPKTHAESVSLPVDISQEIQPTAPSASDTVVQSETLAAQQQVQEGDHQMQGS